MPSPSCKNSEKGVRQFAVQILPSLVAEAVPAGHAEGRLEWRQSRSVRQFGLIQVTIRSYTAESRRPTHLKPATTGSAMGQYLLSCLNRYACKVSDRLSVQGYMDLSRTRAAEALRLSVRGTAIEG